MADEPFPRWSIGAGFEADTFAHLSPLDRAQLIGLMARIAEQAYRRGVYQCAKLAGSDDDLLPKDIYGWRHELSLDKSPWLDDVTVEPAIERLFAECAELQVLGFTAPDTLDDGTEALGGR